MKKQEEELSKDEVVSATARAEQGGGDGEAEASSCACDASSETESATESEEATVKTAEVEQEKAATPSPKVEPDWKDRYARLLADFDNFKKRTARDREETYRFAESDILRDILPTVDNLALALANAQNPEDDFVKGVRLVQEALLKALAEHGAEPFDSVGKALDTDRMEAIATLPSAEFEEGKVSNEVKRGWLLKERVLRAAQVVVSLGKPETAEKPAPAE